MVIKVINKKVVFIHTTPNFDTSGMIEVESIPEPENNGMIAELFWDNGFYYEYHNPPEEVEEEVIEVEYKPTNDEIRELRQQAYKDRSDSLYLAWQKYLATGDDRAEQTKQIWLDEVAKIDEEFPYNE